MSPDPDRLCNDEIERRTAFREQGESMSRTDNEETVLEQRLRLGVGLHEADRPRILAELDSLNRHLEHGNPDQVDVHAGHQGP